MSKAMQLLGIILLGIFTLVIINLMNDVRTTNESDYYLLQEVTEAAMYDAVDYSFYRDTGLLKADRSLFLESFNRRFAQTVKNDRSYSIKIIDFNETPPKVSVEVSASTVASVKGEVALVTNKVSGIIETIYDDLVMSRPNYKGGNTIDGELPEIELVAANQIEIRDAGGIDKYCLGYVKTGNKIEINNFECDGWANNAYNKQSYSIEVNQDYYQDKSNYTKAIVVYDKAGNYSISSIIYTGPMVVCKIDKSSFTIGHLNIRVSDFYQNSNSSYVIKSLSTNRTILSGTFDKYKQNKNRYESSKTINNFFKDHLEGGNVTYRVTVTNDKGFTGYCDLEIDNKYSNQPAITYVVTSKNAKNMRIDISDIDGDLRYYAITDSETRPSDSSASWKKADGNIQSVSRTYQENKTFYIHAIDSVGHATTKEVNNLNSSYAIVPIGCNDSGWYLSENTCKHDESSCNGYKDVCNGPEDSICSGGTSRYVNCKRTKTETSGFNYPHLPNPNCNYLCGREGYDGGSNPAKGYCICSKTTTSYRNNQTSCPAGYSVYSYGDEYCPSGQYESVCNHGTHKECDSWHTDTTEDAKRVILGCRQDGSILDSNRNICDFYFEGQGY